MIFTFQAWLKTYLATADLYDRMAICAFCILLAIIGLTFKDYGIGWDDAFQSQYGDLVVRFLQSGGADRRAIDFRNLRFYGGLFEAPVQYLAQFMPWQPFDTRHLMIALAGFLGILGAWRFARDLGGSLAGLLALLFLSTLPSFYGHLFINSKDIPFATAYIWSLYFMLRAAAGLPALPWRHALLLGMALGITLGIRVGGIVLIGYMGLLIPPYYLYACYPARGTAAKTRKTTAKTALLIGLRSMLLIFVPAYLLMLSCWPWSLLNPISAVYKSLHEIAQFAWDAPVLFKGAYVRSTRLPATYLPVYLSVKLPDYLLIVFLLALPFAAVRVWHALRHRRQRQFFGYTILGLGIFFPPSYVVLKQTVHYDAIRHFLFILPPLAVLCATVAARFIDILRQRQPRFALAFAAVLTLGIAMPTYSMIQLHPYQYVYYNWWAGGVGGATRRYETDYWATSYREAAHRLTDYTRREAETKRLPPITRRYRVLACGPGSSLAPFLTPNFQLVEQISQADFFVSFTRWNCDRRLKGKIIVRIQRAGSLLAVVKDLRGVQPAA